MRHIERLRFEALAAGRSVRHSPGTAIVAVLTLGVAIGLNVAMVGLVERAFVSPPHGVRDPQDVFTLGFAVEPASEQPGATGQMTTTSFVAFDTVRQSVPAALDAAAFERLATSTTVDGTQVDAVAMLVSGSYFDLLRARPLLGRTLHALDDRTPAGAPVAVLGHEFWIRQYRGNAGAIGKRLSVHGVDVEIVGVMPPAFSGHSSATVDVWVPFHAAMQASPGWDHNAFRNFASIVVRLREGTTVAAAETQASVALDRRVILNPLVGAGASAPERLVAFWLAGVSAALLLIGLANASTLLLVRSAVRRRDLAIRAALGASRGRLLTQLASESLLLSMAAVAAALLLSRWFEEVIRRVLLPDVVEPGGFTATTIAAAGIAGIATLAAGIGAAVAQMPAGGSSADLIRTNAALPRRRAHIVLLVVQTTLSVALLAGAGLFGRSLLNLISQDFGMKVDDVLLVRFEQGPTPVPAQDAIFTAALEGARAIPGVELATPIRTVPFTGFHVPPISVPGMAGMPNVDGQLPFLTAATPELFTILDIRLTQGRAFVAADDNGPPVVLVNETMARSLWPAGGVLGKCIRIGFEPTFDPFTAQGPPGPPTTVPCREVVGVVRDVRQRSVVPSGAEDRLMQYFVPFSQVPPPPRGIAAGPGIAGMLVRSPLSPAALAPQLRQLVVGSRTDLPFLEVRPYAQLLERQVRPWRLGAALLAIFGGLSLVVAAVGLYAAFAHTVLQRRREMAIRMAVGADAATVLALILREACTVAVAGILLGCAVATGAARWLQSMLFETAPSDPLVLSAAALLMLAVATAATYLPARSAARVSAAELLKAD